MDNVWTEKEYEISLGYYYFFYLKHAGTKHLKLFVEAFNKENGENRSFASMSRRFGNYDAFNPERKNAGLNNGGKTCEAMWKKYFGTEEIPVPSQHLIHTISVFIKRYFRDDPLYDAFLAAHPTDSKKTPIEIDDEDEVTNSDAVVEEPNLIPIYKPEPIPVAEQTSSTKIKRNKLISQRAIQISHFHCDLDENHTSFISKNGQPYMEAHHLIPLACQNNGLFEHSLDVIANIVCLCPTCHRKLHHGKEIKQDLKILYDKRKQKLSASGIDVSFETLLELYGDK